MTDERALAREYSNASVIRGSGLGERLDAHGRYEIECIGADGKLKWRDTIENVVTTVGKNLALDTFLAGSAYTVTGPYMGLISSTSYSATAAGDTMSSHAGWLEAGGANAPTYTGNRKTAAWSAAASGSKAMSAALSFGITGTGTVKGAFLVYGSGAVATKDDTNGTLWSAGTFSTGDKAVINGDTLNVQLFRVAMIWHRYEVLPWIIIFITALLVLAFLSWLGWDSWSDLREARGEGYPALQTSVYDRKLNRLDRAGVEAAYRSQRGAAVPELDDGHQQGKPGSCAARSSAMLERYTSRS